MKTAIGVNDDYACIYSTAGPPWNQDSRIVSFYYGYEHTSPEGEWCFVARLGEEILYALSTSELIASSGDLSEDDEPVRFLVHGMYMYLNKVDENN